MIIKNITRKQSIALVCISVLVFGGVLYFTRPKPKPVIFSASVIQGEPLTVLAESSSSTPKSTIKPEVDVVPKPQPISAHADPNNTLSAVSYPATYVICMPMITAPSTQVLATSSVQVVTQGTAQAAKVQNQIQPLINSLPPPQITVSSGNASQSSGQSNPQPSSQSGSNQNSSNTESQTTSSNQYQCAVDTYNCSDFQTQAEAQKVFEACGGVNNDVHRLDRDHDGRVCTSLQ
jgi:hypothetical protein